MSQPVPVDPSAAPSPAPAPPEKGWFAAVLPIVLIAACAELGISILSNSVLPVYFKNGLGIGTVVYGRLVVAFFLAEVLSKSPLGVLADRFGRKPLILFGALVTVFTPILLIAIRYDPFSATAIAVLVAFGFLRALDGLGQAAMWPALYAYVGDVVAEARRATAMGAMNVVYMLGLALSFIVGGFVDDTFGPVFTRDPGATIGRQMSVAAHRMGHSALQAGHHLAQRLHHHRHGGGGVPGVPDVVVNPVFLPAHYFPSFYLASSLFALAAIVAALGLRSKARRMGASPPAAEASPGTEGDVPNEEASISFAQFASALRAVPQFMGIALVMFLGIGCIMTLVKVFALDEFHLTETQFGVLTLGPSLAIAAIAVPAGRLADKWGKTRAVQLGFALSTLGLWGIPLLHHLHGGEQAFILSAALLGVGFVLAFPAWLALLSSLGGEHQRGTIFAAVSTAQGAGAGLGVLLGTNLYDHISHIAPFVASAVLATVGTTLALLFVRDTARRRASPPESV